jgi:hypothetical protein
MNQVQQISIEIVYDFQLNGNLSEWFDFVVVI